jgi:hypothetical protein
MTRLCDLLHQVKPGLDFLPRQCPKGGLDWLGCIFAGVDRVGAGRFAGSDVGNLGCFLVLRGQVLVLFGHVFFLAERDEAGVVFVVLAFVIRTVSTVLWLAPSS